MNPIKIGVNSVPVHYKTILTPQFVIEALNQTRKVRGHVYVC